MRCLMLILFVLAWAMPVFAGTTLTVPFSIVPDSVFYSNPQTEALEPVSVPISQFILSNDADCALGQGTLTIEVINDGIEVQLAGSAVASVASCQVSTYADMTLEVEVPELGGTATMIRLEAEPLLGSFSSIGDESEGRAKARMAIVGLGSSSLTNGPYATAFPGDARTWYDSGLVESARAQTLVPFIPGDIVQIPLRFVVDFVDIGVPTVGTIRVRYELKTTYSPEPSAALSLPLGAAWLAGLASFRG